MKTIILTSIIAILSLIPLNAENLTDRYKQMMGDAPIQKVSPVTTKEEDKKTANSIPETIADAITQIEALKKGQFESTNEFNTRRNSKIDELKHKVKFFSRYGSKEYSAGTAQMKDYNADKERMKLTLVWNNDLTSLLPEIKNLKTVLLTISRDNARKMFEKKDTHFFHIEIAYVNLKLTIAKMLIYDKYELYKKNVQEKVANNFTTYPKYTSQTKKIQDDKIFVSYDKFDNPAGGMNTGEDLYIVIKNGEKCVYAYSGSGLANGYIIDKCTNKEYTFRTRDDNFKPLRYVKHAPIDPLLYDRSCLMMTGKDLSSNKGVSVFSTKNSRGVTIYCLEDKSICKTEAEVIAYMNKSVTKEDSNNNMDEYEQYYNHGVLYMKEPFLQEKKIKAANLFKKSCSGGYSKACTRLASMYQYGIGVSYDKSKILSLYEQGCDGGDGEACDTLASFYNDNMITIVKMDKQKSLDLYLRGCLNSYASSCLILGHQINELDKKKYYQKAAELFYIDCENGKGEACYWLSEIYSSGWGTEIDQTKADDFLSKASEYGYHI